MGDTVIALLMFSSMMLLLLTGQRVFAVIGFVGAIFSFFLWGEGGIAMPFTAAGTLMNWYPLLTLPLFIFMGYMLSESGIAGDLYKMMHVFMGSLPGGLAVGTIGLMIAISALNGLSVAGMAIGVSIALPELRKRGYDKIMVTGVIQGGSTLGIMIPPSIVLILYGMIARVPIGPLWLAGLLPGLLISALMVLYIIIRSKMNPELAPPMPREERSVSLGEKLRLLQAGILPVAIIFLMTGLFVMGITSMVEMAAVGALASIVAALIRGRMTRKVMHETLRQTLSVSCMFMWVILAALSFGAIFNGLGAGNALELLFLEQWGLSPWTVLIMMMASFVILGMFLDDTAMLIIVAPLYVPIIGNLGFNLVWFGILYTVTCQIAYITPPFGYNLFLMRAMAPPDIGMGDIYRSIVPFVFLLVIGLAILMAFPGIALWLPNLVYGG